MKKKKKTRAKAEPVAPWVFGALVEPTRRRRVEVKLSFLRDDELAKVRNAVEDEIDRRDAIADRKHAEELKRTIISRRVGEERIRCGTAGCQCARGKLHGPYWYAHLTMGDGRIVKRYIGRAANQSEAYRAAERLTA